MSTVGRNLLTRCVQAATLAPSLHNSQPWRFRIVGESVEVYADPDRRLEALDSSGRELMISVGAALFTLRLALQAEGWAPACTLFPDRRSPDLVATVEPGSRAPASDSVATLAAEISRRHTNRFPFTAAVVTAEAIEELAAAAAEEGATLTIAGTAGRDAILGLGQAAERRLRAHGGYRAELSPWIRPAPGRRDGIPLISAGPWDALERLPIRDFGLMHPQPWRTSERSGTFPAMVVLTTVGDGPAQWIRAGQALQRVLLVATRLRLATTPISQPVEIPAIREMLANTATGHWPQMIVRIGYGPPATATARRPMAEILEVDGQ
ncbi:Acg family FMN-binding oxidoreductase [Paractinoplanes durhamensis]|uniref:Nitroreductase n=1 Tax=Paractinoplanes durhamensis TaxID=113563 RepID=A0ABQ3YRR2_9ACTN|nr:nitroreductase family protein [Actinoplanes durhamensis]GIE00231.1 nitroreductase [Actinoplanes durhamensis]